MYTYVSFIHGRFLKDNFECFKLLPAPLDVETVAVNDELVERFLRGHLGRLTRSKLDKGTLLSLHYSDGANLPKLIEMVPLKINKRTKMQVRIQVLVGKFTYTISGRLEQAGREVMTALMALL